MKDSTKQIERRDALKKLSLTGAIALFATVAPVKAAKILVKDKKPDVKQKKWAMVVDLRRCVGCMSCQVSCKMENDVPLKVFRSWVKIIQKGKYPNVKQHHLPRLCNHCDNPPCVKVCPTTASYIRKDGVVLIDYDKCIGCTYCVQACPYDSRFLNPVTKTADKCTFCAHRIDKGLAPTCVRSCMGRARTFGDINDPDSKVSKLLLENNVTVLKKDQGTEPKVYYIGLDKAIIGGLKDTVGGAGYYKTI